jgi:lactate permease
MWQQNYTPIGNSLPLSTLVAALPIFVLLYLIGVRRLPAWKSALAGLATALLMAFFGYGMPANLVASSAVYGAAFGLWPIGWVVFSAVLLYRVTLESGQFEVLKDSIAHLADDRRLQILLIAFAFGAFVEGAAGFGTPVAVAGAMLAGLGFSPFYAAAVCLLANTAPVAFGSIAIPIITLAGTTGLPLDRLSAGVGRMCTPLTVVIPAYLILVMNGWKGLRAILPAAATCGIVFAGVMFFVSNFVGPQLTDILASLAAIGALVILFQFWKPKDVARGVRGGLPHTGGKILQAWGPYILLVICVLVWGYAPVSRWLGSKNLVFAWPGLHNVVQRVQPVVAQPTPYAATFNFSWLSAAGTSVLLAAILGSFVAGMSPARFMKTVGHTAKQLALAELTLACVLALAYVMNYSGATATLGLAFVATGVTFPFFSAWLGWLGVFLTGSDTSANALFGSLQVVTATKLGMNQVLMASVNSAGGVTGKMLSLTSVAVASAATSMKREDEALLFRFMLKHSLILTSAMGALALFYAYVAPSWAP